jgi:hypothetical protein
MVRDVPQSLPLPCRDTWPDQPCRAERPRRHPGQGQGFIQHEHAAAITATSSGRPPAEPCTPVSKSCCGRRPITTSTSASASPSRTSTRLYPGGPRRYFWPSGRPPSRESGPLPAVRGGGGTRHRPGRPGRVLRPGRPRRPGNRPCAGDSWDPGFRRASSNDIRSDATAPGSDLYRVKMRRDVLSGKRGNGRDPTRMKSVRRFYPVKVKAEFYPVKGR